MAGYKSVNKGIKESLDRYFLILVYMISHTQGPVYMEGGTEGALVNRATRLTELPWEG